VSVFTIRIIFRFFTWSSAFLFTLFAECFVIFNQEVAKKLEEAPEKKPFTETTKISTLLEILTNLTRTADEVKSHFEWMLMAICCQSTIMIIVSSYYTIESIFDGYLVHVIWNASDVLQLVFRMWLICDMADRSKQSVSVTVHFFM